jgi:hypothetical protein
LSHTVKVWRETPVARWMPRIEGRSKYIANICALNPSLWPLACAPAVLLRPQARHTYCCLPLRFLPFLTRFSLPQ